MTRPDPIGVLVLEGREVPALAAVVSDRIWGQDKRGVAPCVVLRQLDFRPSISGPRTNTRDLQVAALCFGAKSPTGDIQALQVAGLVGEWLNDRGPRRRNGVAIHRSAEQNTGAVLRDPDTDEPYVIVTAAVKVHGTVE